jgi:hypothetical protein
MKQLLIETNYFKVERSLITESIRKNSGRLIVSNMKIQAADTPNKNQRIYMTIHGNKEVISKTVPLNDKTYEKIFDMAKRILSK